VLATGHPQIRHTWYIHKVIPLTLSQFLCAFAISAPLATTTRDIEEQRILHLIEAAQLGPIAEEDLITSSQTAINFLEQQTLAEPENQAELGLLREPKLSTNSKKPQLTI